MAAPVITNIRVSSVQVVDADLQFTMTGEGVYSIAVLPSDEDAPSDEEVLEGGIAEAAFEIVEETVIDGKDQHVRISGMSGGTSYIAYIATSDEDIPEPDLDLESSSEFVTLSTNPNPVINQTNTAHYLRPTI